MKNILILTLIAFSFCMGRNGIYNPLGALKRCISKENTLNDDLKELIDEIEMKNTNKYKPHIIKLYNEDNNIIKKCTYDNIKFLEKYKTTYESVMDCIDKAGPVSHKIRQLICTIQSKDYKTAIIEGIDVIFAVYELILECKKDIFGL